jgi:hypothetical protein
LEIGKSNKARYLRITNYVLKMRVQHRICQGLNIICAAAKHRNPEFVGDGPGRFDHAADAVTDCRPEEIPCEADD